MCSNVEIKAKIKNFDDFLTLASSLADNSPVILQQIDTYFQVPKGRLKLRQFKDQNSELIFYDRPDTEGPKLSNYSKQELKDASEAEGIKKTLSASLGVIGEVKKKRHLFMSGQTRIHVDDVQDLGYFMELEVVLKEGETLDFGKKIADELMNKLKVSQDDLLSASYLNMLSNK